MDISLYIWPIYCSIYPPGGFVDLHTFYTFVEYILIISSFRVRSQCHCSYMTWVMKLQKDSGLAMMVARKLDNKSSVANEIAQTEKTARTF
jgi:hypothetical protein